MTIAALRTQTLRRLRRRFGHTSDSATQRRSARITEEFGSEAVNPLRFVTTTGSCVASHVMVAKSFSERLRGLLARTGLAPGEGLLLAPGGSIHTMGMRFKIDVLFLDRHMRVLKIVAALPPWRGAVAPAQTCYTLELTEGSIAAASIQCGMRLLWSRVADQ